MPGRKFKRILVAIADPAMSSKAVRRAGELAHKTGASVELLHAVPSGVANGIALVEEERFARFEVRESLLERSANRLRREEIIVNTHIETGYPVHEAILRQVLLTKADLLIIEARKHNVFARLFLTQTDFELIRWCPVPLLIVKGRMAWRRPRILAALDPFHANEKPSELDAEIVASAQAIAALVGGSVHAFHSYRPPMRLIAGMKIDAAAVAAIPAQEKAYKAAVRKEFYEALGRYGIAKSRGHLRCGDPAVELPAAVRGTRASVVAMGAISRTGLKRIFIGNTAEEVLDRLRCDVLIVKPPNQRHISISQDVP